MSCTFVCSIQDRATAARTRAPEAGWYRIKEEDHPKRTPLRTSQLLWRAGEPDRTSERSAMPSIAHKAKSVCAASWAFSPWPRSTAHGHR